MANLPEKKEAKELADDSKVTGSLVFRMVSPEDRKKLKQLAKDMARERGLIITVIEK